MIELHFINTMYEHGFMVTIQDYEKIETVSPLYQHFLGEPAVKQFGTLIFLISIIRYRKLVEHFLARAHFKDTLSLPISIKNFVTSIFTIIAIYRYQKSIFLLLIVIGCWKKSRSLNYFLKIYIKLLLVVYFIILVLDFFSIHSSL